MMGLSLRQICLVVFSLLALTIAVGVGMARDYIINVTPKPGGFVLSESTAETLAGIKNVLLVGGTNGIGKSLAEELVRRGISVTVVGRTAPENLMRSTKVRFVKADLSSMRVARDTAISLKDEKFDVLFFTIGISPMKLARTPEGIESDLAVSYLSRHVMINEFINSGYDKIKLDSGKKPRVFLMGAPGLSVDPVLDDVNWETSFSAIPAHINTHIFNEALVHHYAKKYPSIEFFGLNPGMIVTSGYTSGLDTLVGNPMIANIIGSLLGLLFQSKEDYVEHVLVPLLANPEIKSCSLFNTLGNEIVPNPWFNIDLDARSKQLVTINNDLLKKYNL